MLKQKKDYKTGFKMQAKQADCPSCALKAIAISLETLKNQVTPLAMRQINPEALYYYCQNKDCLTAYFSTTPQQRFLTHDLQQTIYPKDANALVCCCFDYNALEIQVAIIEKKASVSEQIAAHTKAGRCSCKTRNPAGRCCLLQVKVLEQSMQTQMA